MVVLAVVDTKKKGRGTYGLYSRNFPSSVKWRVDYNYLHKLSKEEQEWLAKFSDRYYGAEFRGDSEDDAWTVPERRRAYIDKNTANTDAYSAIHAEERRGLVIPLEELPGYEPEEDPNKDRTPTPEYLNSPEYKQRLEEYRRLLDPGRKPVKPKITPALQLAHSRLAKTVKKGMTGTDEEE